MVYKKKISHISKKEIEKIDPMLKKPTEDIVQNLAEGIDEMVPDPDDIPGGIIPGTPDILESIEEAFREQQEDKIIPSKKK